MSKEQKMEQFLEDFPNSYLISREFTLPRPSMIKLKEKALEEGWTLNQAMTIIINKKIEEI
ncbi:MAG: hypothetical protein ABEJ83_01825 [Candidatus Nanohaloarchaea archaeon]